MDSFLKTNKALITYALVFLIVIPIFGINFLISFVGNILLILFLITLLILLLIFLSFSSFKSKINTCQQCGTISVGTNNKCINCGSELNDIDLKNKESFKNPSERTIEIEAEEIN